jgi:hypothetical protein
VLQQLTRHESIVTALKYYVGQIAEGATGTVWKTAESNQDVNSQQSAALSPATEKSRNPR